MPTAAPAISLEQRVNRSLAIVSGALFGVSALFQSFYANSVWGPLCLGALAFCLAVVVGARGRPSRLALSAIGGLVGLWLWSLISRGWSESPATALVDSNRWALYAAILTALVLIVHNDRRAARLMLAGATAGVLAVGLYILGRLLFGDARSLFLGARLNRPLGYINGEGCYLLLGFWPLVALAEDWRRPLLAAPALAGATMLTAIAFLSQSRGSLLAFVVAAVLLALVLPGRRVRILAVLTVVAAVSLISSHLEAVYRHPDPHTGIPTLSALHDAGRGALEAAIGAGLAWALVCLCGHVFATQRLRGRSVAGIAAAALVLVIALAAGGVAIAREAAIRHAISRQYNAFVHLDTSQGTGATRLFSGSGDRYDYWRIAWSEFKSQPLRGVGAGGYDVGYYRRRRTTEEITQPHSIELQTLAELGVIGGLALLVFVGSVLAALVGKARIARTDGAERVLAVAAGGTFAVWLAQTSVDWMHYLPGVTGIALCSVAVLTGSRDLPAAERRRLPVWVPRAVVAVAVVVAAVMTIRMIFSQRAQTQAEAALVHDPVGALASTNTALSFESDDVTTYYVRSAALARLGLYQDARRALLRGLQIEPHNWVTWALLGDLAVRHGDLVTARHEYHTATTLNPFEAGEGDLQVPASSQPPAAGAAR